MKKFIILAILFSLLSLQAEDHIINIDRFVAVEAHNIQWVDHGITLLTNIPSGYMISSGVATEKGFNGCTISWLGNQPKPTQIKLQVRVSSDGQKWSAWSKPCLWETDLNWEGLFHFIQYRVEFQRSHLQAPVSLQRITFLCEKNTYDKKIPSKTIQLKGNKVIAKPQIVSRSGWKARSPKNPYSPHIPNKITLHHTYRPTASQYAGSSSVRQIQNYHMDSNGWSDIGYHFLIGTYPSSGSTSIYQGRPENKIGAHTGGNNTGNIGVCSIGDYGSENYHPRTYSSLISLLSWLCQRYGISPNRIYGHRDFSSTACPGQILYNKIPQIREDVRRNMGLD